MRRSAAGLRPATHSQRGTNAKRSDCCAGARPQVRHSPSRARQGGLCGAAGCALLVALSGSLGCCLASLVLVCPGQAKPCYTCRPMTLQEDLTELFCSEVVAAAYKVSRPTPTLLRYACPHACMTMHTPLHARCAATLASCCCRMSLAAAPRALFFSCLRDASSQRCASRRCRFVRRMR